MEKITTRPISRSDTRTHVYTGNGGSWLCAPERNNVAPRFIRHQSRTIHATRLFPSRGSAPAVAVPLFFFLPGIYTNTAVAGLESNSRALRNKACVLCMFACVCG